VLGFGQYTINCLSEGLVSEPKHHETIAVIGDGAHGGPPLGPVVKEDCLAIVGAS
jgi:hypothetical protein